MFRTLFQKYLRRKQRLNQLKSIAKPTYIHTAANFNFHRNISIGKYCRIGNQCHLDGEGGIEIQDGTIFAPRVVILTSSHNWDNPELLPYNFEDKKLPVLIGKGSWLGWGALILPGVTLGKGVVVAARSVVTKSFPDGSIIGGNPAKLISNRKNADINELVSNEFFFLKQVLENNKIRQGRKTKVKNFLIE